MEERCKPDVTLLHKFIRQTNDRVNHNYVWQFDDILHCSKEKYL